MQKNKSESVRRVSNYKQQLDEVFVISGTIKVLALADYTCLDLYYSGYHKNWIQLLFQGKYPKTIVWNASRFYLCFYEYKDKHTKQLQSLTIIQVLTTFSQGGGVGVFRIRTARSIIWTYN